MSKLLFKVWNVHRTKKVLVVVSSEESDIYSHVVLKASEKMHLDGSSLVLESCGTEVDDDECLKLINNETLILLQKNEIWLPQNKTSEYSSSSLASTVTLVENNNESGVIIPPYENNDTTIVDCSLQELKDMLNDKTLSLSNNKLLLNEPTSNIVTITTSDCGAGSSGSLSEDVWRRFEVPWSKLPNNYLNMIKEGKRFKDRYKKIVEICIDELRFISTSIPYIVYKRAAHKIIEQYPGSFLDTDDDGIVLGDGTCTLVKKMIDRNNYLNKPHKRKLEATVTTLDASTDNTPSIGKKKKLMAAKAGCSHWQPVATEEAPATIEQKIKTLNEIDVNKTDQTCLGSLLEDTYFSQRTFLNKEEAPTITDVKGSWPILLNYTVMKWHFEKLTAMKLEDLEFNLKRKSFKILEYGKIKKISSSSDIDMMTETEKCLESLKIVAKLLKETTEELLHTIHDMNEVDKIQSLSPCLIILDGDTDDKPKYLVSIEKEMNACNNFFEALQMCYAAYYIFNMKYPPKCSSTLEFIQRYFMKTHPDKGTKGSPCSKKKVITLLKNLADFELQ